MAARIVKIPLPNSTLRSQLHPEHNSIIDGVLKELRTLSRQLVHNVGFWKEETQLLERIYYKSLNQHRGSVFWRRVVEMRRFVQRINDVNITNLLDSLRYSFFDKNGQANSKLLKNTWSYVPGLPFVTFLSERIKAAHTLVKKARERYALAHESLILLMRTGSFLQLVLVLVAIVSRLNLLLGELEEILQSLLFVLARIINFIKASERTQTEKVKVQNVILQVPGYEQLQLPVENITYKFHEENETRHLDSYATANKLIENSFVPSTMPYSSSNMMDGILETSSTESFIQSEQKTAISASNSSLIAGTSSSLVYRTKKVIPSNGGRKGQSKKKTSIIRRDEIDDIFAGI